MHVLHGTPLSPGYADGIAVHSGTQRPVEVPRYRIDNAQVLDEYGRFHEAVEHSVKELEQIRQHVREEFGQAQSEIFSAHLAILRDPKLITGVKGNVCGGHAGGAAAGGGVRPTRRDQTWDVTVRNCELNP